MEGGSRLTASGLEQELPFLATPPQLKSDQAASQKCDMLSGAPVSLSCLYPVYGRNC